MATNPIDPKGTTLLVPVALPHPNWPHLNPLDEAERMNADRQERVDKSALALSEPRRIRNSGHLALVASKPCLICGRNRSHAHHLKFAQPTALGRKVSDEFTVPLCSTHHRELHQHGDERKWWAAKGIDALGVAEELWRSGRPVPHIPSAVPYVTEDKGCGDDVASFDVGAPRSKRNRGVSPAP